MPSPTRCPWPGKHEDYIQYHDKEWGVPCFDSQRLFEKLCLEGQQAGLSWLVVLRKRAHYRRCFYEFEAQRVAQMSDAELEKLLLDPGLIRHRAKLQAIRNNARAYLRLQQQGVDFSQWLWSFVDGQVTVNLFVGIEQVPTQTAQSQAMSRALKKAGFAFVGPVGCYAFMQSMGMVNDHLVSCFRHAECVTISGKRAEPAT